MATKTHEFISADRYRWDFDICAPSKGFAQVDTDQDAWYYGNWANPTTFTLVEYAEGDVYTTVAESAEEFRAEIQKIVDFCERNGHKFLGIDPMLNEAIRQAFIDVGLERFLH